MAEFHYYVLPADPGARPQAQAASSAEAFVRGVMPGAQEVRAMRFDGPQFYDSGQHFEHPVCPGCGASVEPWWADAMAAAWNEDASRFDDLRVVAPCCGAETALDRLHYPGGDRFAVFAIEVRFADPGESLSAQQLERLEGMLGCRLVANWVAR